jgi:hypothetical protein
MSAPLNRLGGLSLAVFLAACGEGAATTPGPGPGGAGPDSGVGGDQGTGGAAGTGGRSSTAGTGGAGGGAGSTALSFQADIWPVFDQVRQPAFVYRGTGSYEGCTANGVCHGGATPGARLSMIDSATAYAALFEVASTTSLCGGTIRVAPGDPDRSCLVLFYEGRLRDDLQWVDQAEIDLVRRWIAEGARP